MFKSEHSVLLNSNILQKSDYSNKLAISSKNKVRFLWHDLLFIEPCCLELILFLSFNYFSADSLPSFSVLFSGTDVRLIDLYLLQSSCQTFWKIGILLVHFQSSGTFLVFQNLLKISIKDFLEKFVCKPSVSTELCLILVTVALCFLQTMTNQKEICCSYMVEVFHLYFVSRKPVVLWVLTTLCLLIRIWWCVANIRMYLC